MSIAEAQYINEAVEHDAAEGLAAPVSQRRDIWRRFRRNKLAIVGMVMIAMLVLLAVFAPLWVRLESSIGGVKQLDPKVGTLDSFASPSGQHWFGTDNIGRDVLPEWCTGLGSRCRSASSPP